MNLPNALKFLFSSLRPIPTQTSERKKKSNWIGFIDCQKLVKLAVLFLVVFLLATQLLFHKAEARKLFYKEEFYRIYYLPLTYQNDDLARNLLWLEHAEKASFAPPIQALSPHEDEVDYLRYRKLLDLHIQYLLARNTLYLAARFDKHRPVYFNLPYAKDILKSIAIADHLYKNADIYWKRIRQDFEKIRKMEGRSHVQFLEKLVDKIQSKELDFGRTIARKQKNLATTRNYFESGGKTPLNKLEPPRQKAFTR